MTERERFESLYRANVRVVNAYACARLGRDVGEDVTSEVFHAAVVAFRTGREPQVTRAWLLAVARNKVIDRWRLTGRRRARSHLVHARPEDLVDDPEHGQHDERREAVVDALSEISERHRMLLILHHVEGRSIREISETLGQSDEAIESALVRARQSFRRSYRPQEVAS